MKVGIADLFIKKEGKRNQNNKNEKITKKERKRNWCVIFRLAEKCFFGKVAKLLTIKV